MTEKNNDCFIAVYEEFYGEGSTLRTAFNDLKSNGLAFDEDEVTFYRATRIKVELEFVEVPENES
jgi:hypothetical protein